MILLNRFTCSKSQLGRFVKMLHDKNTPPIIDYVNECYDLKNFYELQTVNVTYPNNHIALKPSTLGIREDLNLCMNHIDILAKSAQKHGNTLLIDAEEHDVQDEINELSDYLMEKYNKDKVCVYKTYQMYKKQTPGDLLKDLEKGRNYHLGIKLVRGAYYNLDSVKGVLCDNIQDTHTQYDGGIINFCKYGKNQDVLMCATHNEHSVDLALNMIYMENKNIEFAQLLGMNDKLTRNLQSAGHRVYKYLPYGDMQESIPYLIRRLYENYSILQYIL